MPAILKMLSTMNRIKLIALSIAAVIAMTCIDVAGQNIAGGKYRKALVIGAHPDDPETIAGGTMLVLKSMGCEVVSVYLTSGEAGIKGKTHEEAAAIRRQESEAACRVMGVRHIFMGQIDGAAEVNAERYAQMKEVIEREKPDVVFTHWPIDSHRDHRVTSLLVYDAWRQLDHAFDLYYCEAMSGLQSQNFTPTDYVNIDAVVDTKHEACMKHVSQGMPEVYQWHSVMEKFRGLEFHCNAAEAFVKQLWTESDITDR